MTNSTINDNDILNRINWRPGHMLKAMREIKAATSSVDIIIEVRDARVPLVSGNKSVYNQCQKPHLIVFNKTNLADPETVKLWIEWLTKQKESFIFINAMDKNSTNTIVKQAKKIIHKVDPTKKGISVLLLGLPNTGKSTIINKLSNRNATKAAATPGQTKFKLWVNVDKDLRILDTPGIMPPEIKQEIHTMWLSAIHAVPDHIITPDYSACFLVEHFLKERSEVFQKHYELESLDMDLIAVVESIGKRRGCLRSGGVYDYDKVYNIILGDFRKGSLGVTSFERPPAELL